MLSVGPLARSRFVADPRSPPADVEFGKTERQRMSGVNANEREVLLEAFGALLRPFMKVAFQYGVSAADLGELVRQVYISALERQLALQGRPASDARIAVMGGFTKGEVQRTREALRSGNSVTSTKSVSLDQITSLLTVWHTDGRFSTAYGLALDLSLKPGGGLRTFAALIDVACPGVDQDVLLDELVASSCVEIHENEFIRCLSRAYVPKGKEVGKIARMGRFLAAISENFSHNVLREDSEKGYFERAVIADSALTEEGKVLFLQAAETKGQAFLEELDTWLTGLGPPYVASTGKKYGLGLYFFEEPQLGPALDSDPNEWKQQKREQEQPRVVEEIDVLAPSNAKR